MSVKKLNAIAGAYNSIHKDMAAKKAIPKKKKMPVPADEKDESPAFEAGEDGQQESKKKGKI